MKKTFKLILILLLIGGGGAWYFLTYRVDALIGKQIEAAGASSLGSLVSVGTVTTSIRDGSLNISNVTVANPPGFRNKNAFSLNNIDAAVDYANLDIKRLVIDNPEIVIEEMGGETNFSRMLAAMEQDTSEPGAASDGKTEPIIVIRHFRMNESRAAFESESLDRYSDVRIDAIEMADLRGTPREVARMIATEVLEEVTREAATELLKAQARNKLEKVETKISKKLKDLLGKDEDEDSGN